ncbi:uncharacterized protein LOC115634539 [Scaptodrosophila lebanonensis]|uniref:Uncharacterized protein LOC115634539 n=1 Tax=Drosophila lebanonensis TaxID=7225 RepID=A0A6J2UIZ6_DROLE|nr:uncharacterized protein LOC115634539 [Scaptodrosophila lebanonensis]
MLVSGKSVCKVSQSILQLSRLNLFGRRCPCAVQQHRLLDTLYGTESCEECVEAYVLPTLKKGLKKREKPDTSKVPEPCWQALRRTEYKCRTDPEFNLSAWLDTRKECIEDDCATEVPRSDLTKYRPGDKLNRKYQRTWVECVLKRRKMRAKCVFKPPSMERRKRKTPKKGSCDVGTCTLGAPKLALAHCTDFSKDKKCPRQTSPGCGAARIPGKCRRGDGRAPKDCRKRLTKYPSFSECLMDPLPDAPPTECNCLQKPSMCSVWEYFRNKKS